MLLVVELLSSSDSGMVLVLGYGVLVGLGVGVILVGYLRGGSLDDHGLKCDDLEPLRQELSLAKREIVRSHQELAEHRARRRPQSRRNH